MWSSEADAVKHPTTPLLFRWLGTAGIELVLDDLVIAIDPYFSRVPTWKLWLGRVTPDRELIADRVRRCDLLLVTHAHFDHIMDVPEIVRNTEAMVAGSPNSCRLLEALGVPQNKIREINAGDQISVGQVRIEVHQAKHPMIPGFSPGPLRQDIRPPLRASSYRMDHCYSFLISVNGTRLLTDPGAQPDDAVAADVLFVQPGKDQEYYKSLLRLVRPEVIIPIHWDDFFRPLSEPVRPYWKPPALAFPPLQRIDLEEFKQTILMIAQSSRVLEPEIDRSYDLGAYLFNKSGEGGRMTLLTGDEVIEIAMRLEERGEAFYNAAAEKATKAEVKSLFEELAVQEQYHRRAFQEMGRGVVELALSPEQWDQFQAYTGALLKQSLFDRPEGALSQAVEARDEQNALQAALGFEKETLLFFHELRDVVKGPTRQTIDRIMEEERGHIQRLSGMLAAS